MKTHRGASFGFAGKLILFGAAAASAAYAIKQRRRMSFAAKRIVITGASRGLGLELARGFAREHARVVLLARNQDQLDEAKHELEAMDASVSALVCDVSNEQEARRTIASIAVDSTIDVLINNAGIIHAGPSEHTKLEDFAEAMAVHFWGPLHLMREVIPLMKRQGGGRIVNIASIGGKVAVPHLLPYTTSKFALVGLSEGLRAELIKDGIYVTTVCPGLMRTGSHINAFFKGQHKKEFALFSLANAFPLLSIDSAKAARQIIDACRYGTSQLVITPQARALRLFNSLFPALTAEILSLVNLVLPGPAGADGDRLLRGWQCQSAIAPSRLTRSADVASNKNNEAPQPAVSS
jgi:short-subunit dehydrogenase